MKKTDNIAGKTIVGIDYGNKYAGTTVICYNSRHEIKFVQSSKNADADSFLLNELTYLNPDLIMIDAPLSLPGVYWLSSEYKDHFFRSCDRELRAMSPMFLGGLTARAISLIKKMNGTEVLETYHGNSLISCIFLRQNTNIQSKTWDHLQVNFKQYRV